jgi:hypothetical protein
VELTIQLSQGRFLVGEAMPLQVVLRNTGPAAVDAPAPGDNRNAVPVYTLAGPQYPDGVTIHFRGIVGRFAGAGPAPAPVTVRLAPGESHEAVLAFEKFVRITEPGEYTLTAALGDGVRSAAVRFVVAAPAFRGFAILADDGGVPPYLVRVLGLAGEGDAQAVYQALFIETRSGIGEIAFDSLRFLAPTGGGADELIAPWANTGTTSIELGRYGWRVGPELAVADGTRFRLPGPARLLRPALAAAAGVEQAVVLGGDLALVRFPAPRPQVPEPIVGATIRAAPTAGPPEPPAVLWRRPLPGPVEAGRCCLAPPAVGDRRAVVLVTRTEGGVRFHLAGSVGGGEPDGWREVEIPDAHPLPESEPAVRFGADGSVHAAVVLGADAEPKRLGLASVVWPADPGEKPRVGYDPDGSAAPRSTADPGRWAEPVAAAAAFPLASRDTARLEWAVLLDDGRVIYGAAPGHPHRMPGAVPVPLQLLPMSVATYLLSVAPEQTPRFALLHT